MSAPTDPVRRAGAQSPRGFALPLAILALALVTAAVAASSASTRAETVANQAVRAQDRAYQLAEAGLQAFLTRRSDAGFCDYCVTDPSTQQYKADSTETTRVSLTGGYADVVSMRVRPRVLGDSVAIFFLRSRGVDTTLKMSGTGFAVYAERTVGMYATFRTASIKPIAALVSITGLLKSSNNSAINGFDVCTTFGACPLCVGSKPNVPGLLVPSGEYHNFGGYANPTGSPVGVDATMSVTVLKLQIGIDWNAIINNNAIPADYTDSWPGSAWAVTRYNGNLTIDASKSDGKGILIVTGNLTLSNNRDFDGIILAGGQIFGTGIDESAGLAYSGLNFLLPGAANPVGGVFDDAQISNNKRFRYNSCNVAQAMRLLTSYYTWSNTWLDNVASW